MNSSDPVVAGSSLLPELSAHRHVRRRGLLPPTLAAAFFMTAFNLTGLRHGLWHSALLQPLAFAPAGGSADAAGSPGSECEELHAKTFKKVNQQLARWEKVATEGQTIHNFGNRASRLLNRTLTNFDKSVKQQLGEGAMCRPERQALEHFLQQQLESIFLVQRSAIEQALYQRLKKELLRRMRRKKRELDVKEKLKLLHACMNEYDSQVRDLLPFFVQSSERDRAERRLSELQWGIADTPEAKEMQNRWKMERLRRMPMRQSKGPSVSLSPGMRLMLRPGGFGNLQVQSRRQVGPPHNPNEVSIGLLNDGNVMDVYNKKPKPPLIKFQPTIGIEMSVG